MDTNLTIAYNIDELSEKSREEVLKFHMSCKNNDGSFNSHEDVLGLLREDNVLFDSSGMIMVG